MSNEQVVIYTILMMAVVATLQSMWGSRRRRERMLSYIYLSRICTCAGIKRRNIGLSVQYAGRVAGTQEEVLSASFRYLPNDSSKPIPLGAWCSTLPASDLEREVIEHIKKARRGA